jgi:dinuclear metal center YbgI/SA1388 family protein
VAKKTVRIQDVVGLMNTLYPPILAEEWDNVGLQVGDPGTAVSRVAVALDPSPVAVEEAIGLGAELLLCHHPLIFRPMKQVTTKDETGRVVTAALRGGLSIMAAHTNLDRAHNGMNDWLAESLGIENSSPIELPAGLLIKLIVFVPVGQGDEVAEALFDAGAGHIGAYDRCSFRTGGIGTFRPGAESQPFIGKTGEVESVEETRLEVLVPKESLSKVVNRLIKVHPYEEVAYDVIPITNARTDLGLGRIGRLKQPTPFEKLLPMIKSALQVESLRISGPGEGVVKKVAVCGGSGASLLQAASRQGADLLVTGDVSYHDARRAEELGLTVVDAGHFATEHIFVKRLTQILKAEAQQSGLDFEVSAVTGEQDPFRTV